MASRVGRVPAATGDLGRVVDARVRAARERAHRAKVPADVEGGVLRGGGIGEEEGAKGCPLVLRDAAGLEDDGVAEQGQEREERALVEVHQVVEGGHDVALLSQQQLHQPLDRVEAARVHRLLLLDPALELPLLLLKPALELLHVLAALLLEVLNGGEQPLQVLWAPHVLRRREELRRGRLLPKTHVAVLRLAVDRDEVATAVVRVVRGAGEGGVTARRHVVSPTGSPSLRIKEAPTSHWCSCVGRLPWRIATAGFTRLFRRRDSASRASSAARRPRCRCAAASPAHAWPPCDSSASRS